MDADPAVGTMESSEILEVEMSEADEGKRIEYAPAAGDVEASAGIINVTVNDDEEVRWYWTHYPNGRSVVTGYDIIKKDEDAESGEFSFKEAVSDLLWPAKKNKDHQPDQASAPDESLRRTRKPVGFLSSASAARRLAGDRAASPMSVSPAREERKSS